MRILLLLLIVHTVDPKSIEKRIPLYTVNNSYSIFIVDKGNKISFHNDTTAINGLISYLYSNENYILIGGNDQVFNISQKTVSMNTIAIMTDQKSMLDCKSNKCENNLKVALPLNESTLITCGTNYFQCNKNNETQLNLHIYSNKLTNIAPFSYKNSVYSFHLISSVIEIFKQNFNIEQSNVMFNEIVRLPNGAIRGMYLIIKCQEIY